MTSFMLQHKKNQMEIKVQEDVPQGLLHGEQNRREQLKYYTIRNPTQNIRHVLYNNYTSSYVIWQ